MNMLILVLGSILIQIQAKLQVLRPQTLVDDFYSTQRDIQYSVANFGDIPWGRQMVGDLEMSDPLNACQPLKPATSSFLLVQRGNCTFVDKVRNAQTAGYQLVIIEDNLSEQSDKLTMSDDGTGYTVSIPSIFISYDDGAIFQKYINGSQKIKSDGQPIQLKIKFDVQQSENVQLIFALTFRKRESFKLIREYQQFYDALKGSNVNYELLYQLYQQPTDNFAQDYPDCLSGGRYCALDPDGDYKIGTGRNVVEEVLRQLCLFKTQPDNWFAYMDSFDKNCTLPQAFDGCSNRIRKQLKVDEESFLTCIERSYINDPSTNNPRYYPNELLDRQLFLTQNSGVKGYPGAMINQQAYLGKIDAMDIFGEVCNSFLEPPETCAGMVDDYQAHPTGGNDSDLIYTVLLAVGIMILFFIAMFYVYTKMVNREANSEANPQVNELVSQYINFYEAKDKKKSSEGV